MNQRVIVITGSTRGIGYGLADAFLQDDCAVVVNGRSREGVARAVDALAARHDPARLLGQPGDVTDPAQVQTLWDAAHTHFGRVDIWINNAGIENRREPLWELSAADVEAVVDANLLGTIYGCQTAIRGMLAQGDGHIYNMEGFGSAGRMQVGLTPYGATKYAVTYLTKSLVQETAELPVRISLLNPGMVLTDMLLENIPPEREAHAKRIFNILADRVETVAPWLAQRILQNEESGAHIAWLTTPKIIGRFLLARIRRRDLFAEGSAGDNATG
jgi:NAD(P)-dependent dehydrogenase (short-subunit alcohol dehydrogenase family)